MKSVTLVCLFLAVASSFAQNELPKKSMPGLPATAQIEQFATDAPQDQNGCPVRFTDISLKSKGRLMLVQSGDSSDGDLSFQYQNRSGKTIQSIAVSVELKFKQNVYALDTTDYRLDMTLTGKGLEETLPININGHVYGVRHVTLERVSYADGSNWTASAQNVCRFESPGTPEKIVTLQ
jgi:hypothetical protein